MNRHLRCLELMTEEYIKAVTVGLSASKITKKKLSPEKIVALIATNVYYTLTKKDLKCIINYLQDLTLIMLMPPDCASKDKKVYYEYIGSLLDMYFEKAAMGE